MSLPVDTTVTLKKRNHHKEEMKMIIYSSRVSLTQRQEHEQLR